MRQIRYKNLGIQDILRQIYIYLKFYHKKSEKKLLNLFLFSLYFGTHSERFSLFLAPLKIWLLAQQSYCGSTKSHYFVLSNPRYTALHSFWTTLYIVSKQLENRNDLLTLPKKKKTCLYLGWSWIYVVFYSLKS